MSGILEYGCNRDFEPATRECTTTINLVRYDPTVPGAGEHECHGGVHGTRGYYRTVISGNHDTPQDAVDEACRYLERGGFVSCTVVYRGEVYKWKR
jgi:hypothetical protein